MLFLHKLQFVFILNQTFSFAFRKMCVLFLFSNSTRACFVRLCILYFLVVNRICTSVDTFSPYGAQSEKLEEEKKSLKLLFF
jgi:hypothetical protein